MVRFRAPLPLIFSIMKFVNDLNTGSQIIRKEFPEFQSCHLAGDDSGWDNYAIRVNDEYLFRFPRRQESLEQIKRESELLSILQSKLPPYIEVPKYLTVRLNDDYPFVYYKMIQGRPLTKELYNGFTNEVKERFVQQFVDFLNILHNIDINQCKDLGKVNSSDRYRHLYQRVIDICFKFLTKEEQNKTKRLFENYLQDLTMQKYAPTVVHGDLSENHIIVTKTSIGIIDFGDTAIFDPAIDISWFYLFDKKVFYDILAKYHGRKDAGFERRISQFYVPIIPYYGIIYGEETHDHELIEDELNDLRQNLAKV